MSYVLQLFIRQTPAILKITQRCCERRHSSIADVDNLRSFIEGQLPDVLFSPVSWVQELKLIKPCGMKIFVHIMRSEGFSITKKRLK
jgi:hypothetical protein